MERGGAAFFVVVADQVQGSVPAAWKRRALGAVLAERDVGEAGGWCRTEQSGVVE